MSSNTSVGRGPAAGGNENHDGDPLSKTFGEHVKQEPPAGNEAMDGLEDELIDQDRDGAQGKRPLR